MLGTLPRKGWPIPSRPVGLTGQSQFEKCRFRLGSNLFTGTLAGCLAPGLKRAISFTNEIDIQTHPPALVTLFCSKGTAWKSECVPPAGKQERGREQVKVFCFFPSLAVIGVIGCRHRLPSSARKLTCGSYTPSVPFDAICFSTSTTALAFDSSAVSCSTTLPRYATATPQVKQSR